jgi:hypothetical protein
MFKLIIGFMKFIIELAAAALIFSCGAWAYNYASAGGLDTLNQYLYAAGGGLVGLFASTAFLGVPILLLQINTNLDELNATVRQIGKRVDRAPSKRTPHPLEAAFPPRPPRASS